jgi:hypothetical protein
MDLRACLTIQKSTFRLRKYSVKLTAATFKPLKTKMYVSDFKIQFVHRSTCTHSLPRL